MGWKQALVLPVLCGMVLIGRSQTSPAGYQAQWQAVDSLVIQKGLTASALSIVNRLYATARREKNQQQAIKALVYRLHLEEKTSDEGLTANIKELESAIDSSSQPARSVLQNILAGLYQRYLFANYSRFSGRSTISHAKGADVATWSGDDVRKRIVTLYLGSLLCRAIVRSLSAGTCRNCAPPCSICLLIRR
jgi:hypothetical protein